MGLFPVAAVAGRIYSITGIPLGSGLTQVTVAGMNDAGQIVGSAATGFLYTPGSGVTNLDLTEPIAINNRGQILTRAGLLITPGSGTSNLLPELQAAFPGETIFFSGLNNNGQTIASGDLRQSGSSVAAQILLVTPGVGYEVIAAAGTSRAFGGGGGALNDRGDVLYNTGFPPRCSFVHSEDGQTGLVQCGSANGVAYAINNLGQVAGSYQLSGIYSPYGFPVLGSVNGPVVNLTADFSQYLGGAATALNNAGQSVGYVVVNPSGATVPVLFDSGDVINLNDLLPASSGWQITTATAINDAGQIAGSGIFDGNVEAYVLSPAAVAAPEPSGALLLAGVWLLLTGLRRFPTRREHARRT